MEGEIFVYQTTYTQKVLKQFYVDKARPLSTLMDIMFLDPDKDPFRPREEDEDILGPEVPYFIAICALIYLANCTISNILLAINLLIRISSSPIRQHWNGEIDVQQIQSDKILHIYLPKHCRLQRLKN